MIMQMPLQRGVQRQSPISRPTCACTTVLVLQVSSTVDGRRLARHAGGRPHRILPDPAQN
jgi:hypothetical protein